MGTSPPGPRIPKPQRIGGATARSAIDMGRSGPPGTAGEPPSGHTGHVFDEQGVGGMGFDDDRDPADDDGLEASELRLRMAWLENELAVLRQTVLVALATPPSARRVARRGPAAH